MIAYHDQGGRLWRNDNGQFTWIAQTAWPRVNQFWKIIDRHNCDWADVNGDNLPDAYCSVGRTGANNVKIGEFPDNELWLQQLDGTFVDVATQWGVGDPYGRGREVTFINANGDDWPDLYVTNDQPRPEDPEGEQYGMNKLYINDNGTSFHSAPEFGVNTHLGGGYCVKTLDYNSDGWEDMLVCANTNVKLFRNNGGVGFIDASTETGLSPRWYRDVDFVDLDENGTLDLVGIHKTAVEYRLFVNGKFGTPRIIMPLTLGREVALGDADGDGDPDVYALQGSTSDTIINYTDYIVINDNLSFQHQIAVPAAGGGGDTVEPIDFNRDGRTNFIVLNGANNLAGPTQLISLSQ